MDNYYSDVFYPGGWDGAMNDTARRQAEFDSVINQNSGMAPQYIFPYGSGSVSDMLMKK